VQNALQTQDGIGFKRRPLYARIHHDDLRIEHSLYLKLANPLANNDLVEVTNSEGGDDWPPHLRFIAVNHADRYSPVIHVNQEGYLSNGPKKAMVGYYLGDFGEMLLSDLPFDVVDAESDNLNIVYSGHLTHRPDMLEEQNWVQYQKVWEADFGEWDEPGNYFLRVEGLGASFSFRIDDGLAMKLARAYALGLYHQRCGGENSLPYTRHVHAACHTVPAVVPDPQQNSPSPYSITHINHVLFGETGAFNLRLATMDSPSELPPTEDLTILIAKYNDFNVIHFRIYNGAGDIVLDQNEKEYDSSQVQALKDMLEGYWGQNLDDVVKNMAANTRREITEQALLVTWEPEQYWQTGQRHNGRHFGYHHLAPRLQTIEAGLYPIQKTGTVDVSMGHHDAGDYSKYTINSAHLIHTLIFAADNFPDVAQLNNLGLPESNDQYGISDLLELAKWEADFLVKMQDGDGGFFFLVYPKRHRYEGDVLPDHNDPRYVPQVVLPKNTAATAAAVAALAEIGSSPEFCCDSSIQPDWEGTGSWTLTIGSFNGDIDEVRISNKIREYPE
jgi:hypothetical protein